MSSITDRPVVLEMRGITKRFPGVLALDNISFDVHQGEVHALLGENGAGKSTLMKILAGVYQADSGPILFKGQKVSFHTPKAAQVAGITTIHQELNQIPMLSVTENIYLGSEMTRSGLINWAEMHKGARVLLDRLHMNIDPRVMVSTLGVGQQQMVEVAKALHHKSDLIIMDEPTAALSLREIEDLFDIIRDLKAHNVAVIYISHHLDEAFHIADRMTILRDGRHISTLESDALDMDGLIRLMVGRSLDEKFPKEIASREAELLRVEGLTQGIRLRNISFSVQAGEILGIAGLVGAGRTELLRAVFGADPIDRGEIYVDGQRVTIHNPRDAIKHGIVLLPEDRKQQGLVLGLPIGRRDAR